MSLALLYILKTVDLGYYTFRIVYWEVFEMYLECHFYPLQHSAMKIQLWKYETTYFYSSGSLGGGLFVTLGGHVGIPVLWRNLLPLSLGAMFLSFPIILCVTPFEVPVTNTSHYYFIFVITVHQYVSTHWPYANTKGWYCLIFIQLQKSARLKYSWDICRAPDVLKSVIGTMWYVGFEVFVEVKIPVMVVWVITPCCCLIGTDIHTPMHAHAHIHVCMCTYLYVLMRVYIYT